MIKVDVDKVDASSPVRYEDNSQYYLKCINEENFTDMFENDETKKLVDKVITDNPKVRELNHILTDLYDLITPGRDEEFQSKKAGKIFTRILNTDRQLYLDIYQAIKNMIQSRVSCIKGEISRDIFNALIVEMESIINKSDDQDDIDTDQIEFNDTENSILIPDGAEYEEEIMKEGINPEGVILNGAIGPDNEIINFEDISSTTEIPNLEEEE